MKKTQKWFYSLAAAALIFSGCSAKPQEKPADGAMTAGTYTAASSGYAGEMEVSVTVDEEKILTIEIGENNETPSVGGMAIEQLPGQIIDAQSIALDGVSRRRSSPA